MRNINNDLTLKRNYLSKYRFLISEFEQVKREEHPTFRFAKDFYPAHDTDPRSFLKYYNWFKQSGKPLIYYYLLGLLKRRMTKRFRNTYKITSLKLA